MAAFFRRLRARWRYRHFDRDLAREIEVHRAMAQDALETGGEAPDDARAAASRALGNATLAREDARAVWIARWMQQLSQDLRYALRGLRRQPGFAAVIVGMLGLTAGLLTTLIVFTDASLLRPWRVPDPSSVFLIRPAGRLASGLQSVRVPEYFFMREHAQAWRGLVMTADGADGDLTFANGAVANVGTLYVTSNYFSALETPLSVGAGFTSVDDNVTAPRDAVIISHRIWQEYLHGDPAAIGETVHVPGFRSRPFTIVGIAPKGFVDGHSSRNEAWMPVALHFGRTPDERRAYLDPRHAGSVTLIGRLADDVTAEQGRLEINRLSNVFRSDRGIDATQFRLVDTRPLASIGSGVRLRGIFLVFVALALVQLLACANVSNLLLVRALARQREIAVRLSLGAGRARVVRQLLAEAGLLITIAGGLGLAIALAAPHVVVRVIPDWDERPEFYGPGFATFAGLLAIAALSTVIAGVAPAVRATRVGLSTIAGSRHGKGPGGVRLRRILLASQLTLATVLLLGAALLTRGLTHAMGIDPGFAINDFQEVTVDLRGAGNDGRRRETFFRQLYERTRAPEWPPIAFADILPIDSHALSLFVRLETATGTDLRIVRHRPVSADYFDVLGVRLLAGRMPSNDPNAQELALNELAANLLFPGTNPIGRTITTGSRADRIKTHLIVGVTPALPTETIAKATAVAYGPSGLFRPALLVRSRNPEAVRRLEALATSLDPAATVAARPLTEMVADSLHFTRVGSRVAWSISILGLLLAAVGAFGVFAYAVEERRREVGIRMALGARPAQVIGLVLRSMGGTVVIGLGLGLALAAAASPILRSYLYGLSPFDAPAYLQVTAILAGAAAIASWLPVRRATRVNPAEALRAE